MAEGKYKRPYLDSSVFLAAINEENERAEIVRQVLDAADKGLIQIVASTFVVTEVIRIKGESGYLTEDKESAINQILTSDKILFVELDLTLAFEARRLARVHNLKVVDAVHLASAFRAKADILFRYDNRFTTVPVLPELQLCDPYWHGDVPFAGSELDVPL
ncbi:MAG: type II toxin-antitoxin system VapC family toxin [Acidimicrobiales bacterium]